MKLSDTDRILKLFRASGGRLISNTTIINGNYYGTKKILAWSARITDARGVLGCNCGIDADACTATEHIVNVKKNYYQYIGLHIAFTDEPPKPVSENMIVNQLEVLRKKYATANKSDQKILAIRGKALKLALKAPTNDINVVVQNLS